jgi:hypothetical protein
MESVRTAWNSKQLCRDVHQPSCGTTRPIFTHQFQASDMMDKTKQARQGVYVHERKNLKRIRLRMRTLWCGVGEVRCVEWHRPPSPYVERPFQWHHSCQGRDKLLMQMGWTSNCIDVIGERLRGRLLEFRATDNNKTSHCYFPVRTVRTDYVSACRRQHSVSLFGRSIRIRRTETDSSHFCVCA